ncbi:uncharacterized protein B0P05DRAFT_552385 [Gilbertella persicaria]|uniref:uncharacterized protein n=1 Tax=Gilbertella persicaria TaxID=101096 RepID=UPI00221F9632|nr:uncharacterized protein B0P05DRAFT_552385 [Gilbertella persicaria]KAI8067643.1 hypothetical protein B0P05DRAFT_552385 [Gilbertella persicaria]
MNRQVVGSYEVAKETALILRQAISTTRWYNVDLLIEFITELGSRLVAAQPKELAVGNIVRRALKIIREVARGELHDTQQEFEPEEDEEEGEEESEEGEEEETTVPQQRPQIMVNDRHLLKQSSMFNLLSDGPVKKHDSTPQNTYNLKPLIIQEINEEIIADLESVYKGIADQATDFIHANEVIMTIGKSRTVQEFLIRAAQKRKFQVIVAETSPTYQGHDMARTLSTAGIDTTVIADSAIFAAMPRVNKVVLGSHAVLANGGLVAVTGSHLLAAAAKHHSTPVLVCTALYKLSPLFAYDSDTFNVAVAPHDVLNYQEGSLIDKVSISNPYYDYVQPELVSLFIHNLGSAPPTYVYRLINDNYDQQDASL